MSKTTVYVHTEGIGETCLEVLLFQEEESTLLGQAMATSIVIVPEEQAQDFISTVNHMPGCNVTGFETH